MQFDYYCIASVLFQGEPNHEEPCCMFVDHRNLWQHTALLLWSIATCYIYLFNVNIGARNGDWLLFMYLYLFGVSLMEAVTIEIVHASIRTVTQCKVLQASSLMNDEWVSPKTIALMSCSARPRDENLQTIYYSPAGLTGARWLFTFAQNWQLTDFCRV